MCVCVDVCVCASMYFVRACTCNLLSRQFYSASRLSSLSKFRDFVTRRGISEHVFRRRRKLVGLGERMLRPEGLQLESVAMTTLDAYLIGIYSRHIEWVRDHFHFRHVLCRHIGTWLHLVLVVADIFFLLTSLLYCTSWTRTKVAVVLTALFRNMNRTPAK